MHKGILKYQVVLLLAVIVFQSCERQSSTHDDTIARVGQKQLLLSEIKEVVPDDVPVSDSLVIADDYINKWIKKQLLVQKAEQNLTLNQKDLTKELEEYRNSLIIYRYKNELMRQKMDTSVTNQQITNYYEENKDNFKLNNNIVKAVYLRLPEEFTRPKQLKEWCNNPTDENIIELRDFCVQYAKSYDILTENWVNFDAVARNVPLEIDDQEQFLKNNKTVEITKDGYYYLVSVHDYKLKNELAPAEFVKENIKSLIINKRKINFLKEVENNIYKEGIRKNKFKIYKKDSNEIN